MCGRAGSLPETYQRSKRFVCEYANECVFLVNLGNDK